MRFFFYGTLLDADLRRVLCGPAADRWTTAPATLADHRRGRSPGRTYPFLLPAPGESVDGIVADGVDATAAAVMTLYEGLGYRTAALRPSTADGPVPAWAYLPRRAVLARLTWTLEGWERDHKQAALRRVAAWVGTVDDEALTLAARVWAARQSALEPAV